MSTAAFIPPVGAAAKKRGWLANWSRSGKVGLALLTFFALVGLFAPWLQTHAMGEMDGIFLGLSAEHWLGTDYLGRDMLTRIVAGTPYTIGVALVATLLACSAGAMLGLLAAVAGGWLDAVLSRTLDTVVSIPSKMLALVIIAGFGSSIPLLIGVAAVVYTPGCYRIIRSLAVNINAMDYIVVAKARGEGRAYIMRREILPNILGPLLADMGLRFVYTLRLLASLSFLGLGVQPPMADWGSLVRENLGALPVGGVSVVAPALAIAFLTIAVNLVIDNLPGATGSDRETH
ncbi:MAG: ABC transporter permease [Burkholderiales bacterium]|nr:ABC transporter permease [Burkholderiales bacterium]